MAGSLVSRQTYGSGLATGLSAMETFYGFMRDVGGTIAPPWTTGGGQVTPPQMQQAPEQSHSSPGNIDASDNAHDADEADDADDDDAEAQE